MLWLLASYAWAQQSSISSRTYDINGRPVKASGPNRWLAVPDHARCERPYVPVETVEERVVSDSGRTKVIERTISRYDPNGVPGPAGTRTHRRDQEPDGNDPSSSTVSRGEINGSFQLAERSTKVTRTAATRRKQYRHRATNIERLDGPSREERTDRRHLGPEDI